MISFKTVSNSLNRALEISFFNSILKLYRLILKTVRPEHISKMNGISRPALDGNRENLILNHAKSSWKSSTLGVQISENLRPSKIKGTFA